MGGNILDVGPLHNIPRSWVVLESVPERYAFLSRAPQVQMAVDVKFVQDTLKGDGVTEIRMKFIKRIEDNLPAGEE